jgi:hypothetical protein
MACAFFFVMPIASWPEPGWWWNLDFKSLHFVGGVIPSAAVFQAEREPALSERSESKGISRAFPRQ